MFRIPLSDAGKFRVKYRVELCEFGKNKKFSTGDLEKFLYAFHKICKTKEKLITREQFMEIIGQLVQYDNDFLQYRVVWTLCSGIKMQVSPEVWMRTMEIFFGSSVKERIQYCFNVYDEERAGFIRRELMYKFLQNCFNFRHSQKNEEATRYLSNMIFQTFKTEHRYKITFDEYKEGVQRIPLLMEFLGPCLPQMTKEQFFDHLLSMKIV